MPDVYEGDRPYIFACYAHADRDAALPMIGALVAAGYRVWWDEGIELATRYPRRIADHVYGCTCFVMFVSRASIESKWCNDEVNYALDLGKCVLPVYLEKVELTRDLQMRMGRTQSIYWHELSDDVFYRRLFGVRLLDCCLTDEGRWRRGVKARGDKADAGTSHPVHPSHEMADKLGGTSGVVKRDKLADYSWAELKELSRMIAAVGSDAEGLAIARDYGLVDKSGKLCGDEKPFVLKDGTKTSVRILGFRHDELVGGGKAGISFEFADVVDWRAMNLTSTNSGGWEASEMRRWLRAGFYLLIPDDICQLIETVQKWTNNRGKPLWINDTTVVTATFDKLWLLSMAEAYGWISPQLDAAPCSPETYNAEGNQYQLYANQCVSFADYGFCTKNELQGWWLRSPSARGVRSFRCAGSDRYWNRANTTCGVSPGFCF